MLSIPSLDMSFSHHSSSHTTPHDISSYIIRYMERSHIPTISDSIYTIYHGLPISISIWSYHMIWTCVYQNLSHHIHEQHQWSTILSIWKQCDMTCSSSYPCYYMESCILSPIRSVHGDIMILCMEMENPSHVPSPKYQHMHTSSTSINISTLHTTTSSPTHTMTTTSCTPQETPRHTHDDMEHSKYEYAHMAMECSQVGISIYDITGSHLYYRNPIAHAQFQSTSTTTTISQQFLQQWCDTTWEHIRDHIIPHIDMGLTKQLHSYHRYTNHSWYHTYMYLTWQHHIPYIIIYDIPITHLMSLNQQLLKHTQHQQYEETQRSAFFANVSHEIRTSLNGVIGMLEYLSTETLSSEQRDCVDTALSSGAQLLHIMNDIIDLHKVEEGKLIMESAPFTWNQLLKKCDDITHVFATASYAKGVEMILQHVDGDDGITDEVWMGDLHRIGQIVSNFVSNACKFTSSGAVTIRVAPVSITNETKTASPTKVSSNIEKPIPNSTLPAVTSIPQDPTLPIFMSALTSTTPIHPSSPKQQTPQHINDTNITTRGITVSVIDTGIGVAQAKQSMIFEKFMQATASTTREYGGSGLGLCIAKTMANAMNANISIESELSHGTTMTLHLQLPIQTKDIPEMHTLVPSASGTGYHLLSQPIPLPIANRSYDGDAHMILVGLSSLFDAHIRDALSSHTHIDSYGISHMDTILDIVNQYRITRKRLIHGLPLRTLARSASTNSSPLSEQRRVNDSPLSEIRRLHHDSDNDEMIYHRPSTACSTPSHPTPTIMIADWSHSTQDMIISILDILYQPPSRHKNSIITPYKSKTTISKRWEKHAVYPRKQSSSTKSTSSNTKQTSNHEKLWKFPVVTRSQSSVISPTRSQTPNHVRSRSWRSTSELSTNDESTTCSTITNNTISTSSPSTLSIPTSVETFAHISPSSSSSSSVSNSPSSPHRILPSKSEIYSPDLLPPRIMRESRESRNNSPSTNLRTLSETNSSSSSFHLIITVPLTLYSQVEMILSRYPHHHVTVLSKPLRPYQLVRHVQKMMGMSGYASPAPIPPRTLAQRSISVPTRTPPMRMVPLSPLISSTYSTTLPHEIHPPPSMHPILLCDDNLINLKVATKLLSRWFCLSNIDTCRDGRVAVDMFISKSTSSHPYVAIFMDMDMPVMNGLTAARTIRTYEQQHHLTSTPLICMSGNIEDTDIIMTRNAGFNDHLAKPLRVASIQICIHKHHLDHVSTDSSSFMNSPCISSSSSPPTFSSPPLDPIPSPTHSIASSSHTSDMDSLNDDIPDIPELSTYTKNVMHVVPE